MAAVDDLDQLIEQYHQALDEFMKGNPEPAKKLFSHRDDVTLANPFGPVAHGWAQVAEAMERAASHYRDGEAAGFENVAKYVTPELAYLVEIEQLRAKVGGRENIAPLALRVTSILRPEESTWNRTRRPCSPRSTGATRAGRRSRRTRS